MGLNMWATHPTKHFKNTPGGMAGLEVEDDLSWLASLAELTSPLPRTCSQVPLFLSFP